MLVLSRHRSEVICIGEDILITIVEIRGDKVRIGVDAPQAVPVHRQEVYDAIHGSTGEASHTEATGMMSVPVTDDLLKQGGDTCRSKR